MSTDALRRQAAQLLAAKAVVDKYGATAALEATGDVPAWLQNAPGAVEAATALVVDGNPQPAIDWLEHTQDVPICDIFGNPLHPGVFRVVRDDYAPDPAILALQRAPELSERYPTTHTRLGARQAD